MHSIDTTRTHAQTRSLTEQQETARKRREGRAASKEAPAMPYTRVLEASKEKQQAEPPTHTHQAKHNTMHAATREQHNGAETTSASHNNKETEGRKGEQRKQGGGETGRTTDKTKNKNEATSKIAERQNGDRTNRLKEEKGANRNQENKEQNKSEPDRHKETRTHKNKRRGHRPDGQETEQDVERRQDRGLPGLLAKHPAPRSSLQNREGGS